MKEWGFRGELTLVSRVFEFSHSAFQIGYRKGLTKYISWVRLGISVGRKTRHKLWKNDAYCEFLKPPAYEVNKTVYMVNFKFDILKCLQIKKWKLLFLFVQLDLETRHIWNVLIETIVIFFSKNFPALMHPFKYIYTGMEGRLYPLYPSSWILNRYVLSIYAKRRTRIKYTGRTWLTFFTALEKRKIFILLYALKENFLYTQPVFVLCAFVISSLLRRFTVVYVPYFV